MALLFCGPMLCAQHAVDSLETISLEEVIIVGKKAPMHKKNPKSLASVDEYLQQASRITTLRRGAYAWEPMLNNMSSERTVISIDGMRIFSACTDKMDPVTSYVEVSNLDAISVQSGQQGSCHGPTIGGSINLQRRRNNGTEGLSLAARSGFESVNKQRIASASLGYATAKWYADADVMYRKADNYKAGGGREIEFSQFSKYNISAMGGYLFSETSLLEGSVIFDRASNVGYPALPMDVSKAQAVIASLSWTQKIGVQKNTQWETKIYYNDIVHVMDDSKRPNLALRMDMPGWSETFGAYSKIEGKVKKHEFMANVTGYSNRSLAEMTMHLPFEAPMYMVTWPDVQTTYAGIFAQDVYALSEFQSLRFSAGIGAQFEQVHNDEGYRTLSLFYPGFSRQKNRLVKNFAVEYKRLLDRWELAVGAGYGERASSVSEAYGYYLFNSSDTFDYIGNPALPLEKSMEANFSARYKNGKWDWSGIASAFRISDYIAGVVNPELTAMTPGAAGVKTYRALPYATMFNAEVNGAYAINDAWSVKAQWRYSRARDNENGNLPQISPFAYRGSLHYKQRAFSAQFGVHGNAQKSDFAAAYGELQTPAFALLDVSAAYKWRQWLVHAGVENLLDADYFTFSDWRQLPRPGRNFFVNLAFEL